MIELGTKMILENDAYIFIKPFLSQGNHAQIWEIESVTTGLVSVAKFPSLGSFDRFLWEERLLRFNQEISLFKKIDDHFNYRSTLPSSFANYVDVGQFMYKGVLCPVLVLEKYDNSLHSIIEEKQEEVFSRFWTWGQDLLKSVFVLQRIDQGYIHRDLKPRNILLDSSNRLRVIDLGIVVSSISESFTGSMFSSQWAAPEQIFPIEMSRNGNWVYRLNTEVDIYAIGLILFNIATGGEKTESQLNSAHRYEPHRNLYWFKYKKSTCWESALKSFAKVTKNDKDIFFSNIPTYYNNSFADKMWSVITSMLEPIPINRITLENAQKIFNR